MINNLFNVFRGSNLLIIGVIQLCFYYYLLINKIPIESMKANLYILSTIIIAAIGYYHNNILDRDLDITYKDRKDSVLISNKVIYRTVIVSLLTAILIINTLYLFKYLNLWLFFINLISLIMLLLYNYYFKKVMFLGNITIALLSTFPIIVFLYKMLQYTNFYQKSIILFLIISSFLITFIREMVKDMEDRNYDMSYNYITTAIKFSITTNKIIITSISILYILYSLLLFINLRISFLLLPLIFIVIALYYLYKNKYKTSSLVIKASMITSVLIMLCA